MVLTSILVYGSLTAIMFYTGKYAGERQAERKRQGLDTPFFVPEIILLLLSFAFICGARWQVGQDHLSYLKDYLYMQKTGYFFSTKDLESGFTFIAKVFAILHIHFFFYFAFWAFVELFLVLYLFKDKRYLYPYFSIIIVLGTIFLIWNNGMRQAIASCIFIYSYKYIEKRQLIKFLITIFIASLIHHSAVLCIIFYFILNRDLPFNRYWYLLILILGVIIGRTNIWLEFSQNIDKFFTAVGYEEYAGTTTEVVRSRGLGGRSLIILATCALNLWFLPEIQRYFNHEKRIKIYFIMYFLGVTGFFILVNSYVLSRITYYFLIFQIPSLSYLFLYARDNKKNIYYGLIFLFIFYSLASYIIDSSLLWDCTNYKFFWNYYNVMPL